MSGSCIKCPNVEYFTRSNRRRQSKFDANHCVVCFCGEGRHTLLSMQVFRIGFRIPPRRACNQVLGCDVLYLAAFCKADFRYVAAIYSQFFAVGRFNKLVIGLYGRVIRGIGDIRCRFGCYVLVIVFNDCVVVVNRIAIACRANSDRTCAVVINL